MTNSIWAASRRYAGQRIRAIHAGGVPSCQIVMGTTTLHPGSMWNTMPAHTHDRRTEAYLYFDVPDDARVVHLLDRRLTHPEEIVGLTSPLDGWREAFSAMHEGRVIKSVLVP